MEQQDHKGIVDHLFRHEAGKMIAVLTRIFGMHNLQLAEDVVQEAFLKAAQSWAYGGLPDQPGAWLTQVAKNKALDILRRQQNFHQYSTELAHELNRETGQVIEQFFLQTEVSDSQLQMIFACCHPSLNQEDQIALTLKTVSGFSPAEIARALVTSEASIQKRIYRAKQFLRDEKIQLEIPTGSELLKRLHTVHTILYLIFNEGYNSLKSDALIRQDLCAEAARLCLLVNEHRLTSLPSGSALLSLMCLHAARFESRMDSNDSIILLNRQDRTKWNKDLIARGLYYLNASSKGNDLSVYHLEAAIAAEHCLAPDFESTSWMRMLQLYDLLIEKKSTPVVQLNRAVVLSQMGYHQDAIRYIMQIEGLEKLLSSQYLYAAVLGELYNKTGEYSKASEYMESAFALTSSSAEKKLLREKINRVKANDK
jgi:RNA polymerase sigma-70 factor (ECF subfamily)